MTDKYNLYIHTPVIKYFAEVRKGLKEAMINEDYDCVATNQLLSDRINIIFSSHMMNRIPEGSILINFEQLYDGSRYATATYLNLLRNHEVWDYSQQNIDWLRDQGIDHVKHLILGPISHSIPVSETEDIDVLFLGARNQHRNAVMNQLINRLPDKRIVYRADAWGQEKHQLISRAKIILNIHYFPSGIFEIVRVMPLLAAKKFVISEESVFPDETSDWSEGMIIVDYHELVEKVIYYLDQDGEREIIAERGQELVRSREWLIPMVE